MTAEELFDALVLHSPQWWGREQGVAICQRAIHQAEAAALERAAKVCETKEATRGDVQAALRAAAARIRALIPEDSA